MNTIIFFVLHIEKHCLNIVIVISAILPSAVCVCMSYYDESADMPSDFVLFLMCNYRVKQDNI